MSLSHDVYMHEAIRLSERGLADGGGPFGAVVVRENKIVGRGHNQVVVTHDPTAHAEVVAIREACRTLGTHVLEGCVLYASCEPCPMCLGAIQWARIESVVYGADRDDAASAGFDDSHFYAELGLPTERRHLSMLQCMREPARAVLAAWTRKRDRVPY